MESTSSGCCSSTGLKRAVGRVWGAANRRKLLHGDALSTELRRCLSTVDLILIGLGHMMGAGVYVITGTVMLQKAGASTLLAYVLGGLAAMLAGLCYAQFSVNIPKTGTAYNYVYLIFGEVWGFLAGWNLILEYLILVASVGRSLSAYIDSLAGGAIQNGTNAALGGFLADDSDPVFGPVDFLGAALILVFFVLVAVGVRSSVNVNNVMTVVNVAVIVILSVTSFVVGSPENFDSDHGGFFPFGFGGTIAGTGVVFFAYVGFDAIAVASEETKNPSKSMPIAICAAVGIVTVLYCSASLALSLLVPYYEVDPSVPFPSAFKKYNLFWASQVVSVGAIFGMIASLLGQAFCLPRGIYALAKDGLLFSPLTYVNSWTQTPLVSIGVSAVLSSILAMFVKISELVEMVSIGTLFAIALMAACLLKLHYLPAETCPFELTLEEDNPPIPTLSNNTDLKENIPLTKPRAPGQTKASIGKLRLSVGKLAIGKFLQKYNPDFVTSLAVWVLLAATTSLAALLVRGWYLIASGNGWIITVLVITSVIYVSCVVLLLMYEHNTSFAKFTVPLVPWMPILTLLVVLCLMMSLSTPTWIRLVVWVAIGLLIYFVYGIRHSTAVQEDYIELEESSSSTQSVNETVTTREDEKLP